MTRVSQRVGTMTAFVHNFFEFNQNKSCIQSKNGSSIRLGSGTESPSKLCDGRLERMISGVRWISFLARSSRFLGKREEPAVLSVFSKTLPPH
jgi:hypothetical protein